MTTKSGKKNMKVKHVMLPVEVIARLEKLRRRLEKNGPATESQAIRAAIMQGLDSLEGA